MLLFTGTFWSLVHAVAQEVWSVCVNVLECITQKHSHCSKDGVDYSSSETSKDLHDLRDPFSIFEQHSRDTLS